MSKVLSKQSDNTNYIQVVTDGKTGTQTRTGTQSSTGTNTAEGKQSSTGTTGQTSEGATSQVSESTRDLSSKTTRSSATSEKANVGFQISFKVRIVGKIPQLANTSC